MMRSLLSLCVSFLVVLASDHDPSHLSLGNIYLSHGELDPPFDPNTLHYTVRLKYPVDQIAITPKVAQTLSGMYGSPHVTVDWTNYRSGRTESSSMAIRKQIDLPDDGETMRATIRVASPTDAHRAQQYTVDVIQSSGKISILKDIDGIDNNNYGIIVNPFVNEDDSIYSVYVRPDATWVKLQFFCSGGSHVYVNSHSVKNGENYKIHREKDHHMQSLEVTCSKGSYFLGTDVNRSYMVRVMSDWKQIPVPSLILNNSGRPCRFDATAHKGNGEFVCDNPKDRRKAQMTGSIEKSVRYTIESPDHNTEVRVLDGISTIPFSFKHDLHVVAKSGRYEKRWPIRWEGGRWPGLMRILGWILAIILALLLLCLLFILLSSSIAGIGHPFGATEVFAFSTLLIQFLCFAGMLRGGTSITDLVDPLRFFTLFWPTPWKMKDPSGTHHTIRSGSKRGINMWGSSLLGDSSDVRNGLGAMFWGSCLMGLLLLIHMIVIGHFFAKKGTTFPHRLRIGNWESMLMHWLCFPVCTGASFVIFHPNTSWLWKGLGMLVFAVYIGWLCAVLFTIHKQVKKREVTWIWHTSTREDGQLESKAGYWNDVVCDQLTTAPVNRSFFGKLFNWRWISTIADIDPKNIHPGIHTVKNNDTFAPYDFYAAPHHEGDVPMGKAPKQVDVIRSRKIAHAAPGNRLTAGLLRTNWIDILMTYQSVIAVHNHVHRETGRHMNMPLTVKTHQLAGPKCNGSNAYFYDGCRIPFARIGDGFYRVFLGLCMGIALASTRHSVDAIAFAAICAVSTVAAFYLTYTRPYSRHLENWLTFGVLTTIAITSCIFAVLSALKKSSSFINDIIMFSIAALCFLVSIYSIIVIISVISAIMCPPLDETRFLEGLCNCLVTISNHNPVKPFAVDVPAHSKYNCRVLKATCASSAAGHMAVNMFPSGEEPTLEFSVKDIANACRTSNLPAPAVILTSPSSDMSPLGYRHANIYERGNIQHEVAEFLGGDRATRGVANEVTHQIVEQVNRNSKGKTILLVTIVPPKMLG